MASREAILKIDGVFVNKNKGLFMDMEEAVGFVVDNVTDNKGYIHLINNEYFVYAGDSHFMLCFSGSDCDVISDNKFLKWIGLKEDSIKEIFYFENLPQVTIERTNKEKYVDIYGDTYYRERFIATWEYNNHKYECIYGYGIKTNQKEWDNIKYKRYGFRKHEIEIIDKWFKS